MTSQDWSALLVAEMPAEDSPRNLWLFAPAMWVLQDFVRDQEREVLSAESMRFLAQDMLAEVHRRWAMVASEEGR
jgi:hypothetical protein